MSLDLADYDRFARIGVTQFWEGRSSALENDEDNAQGGERAGVLGGKNLDGFVALVENIVRKNGLPDADVFVSGRSNLTLPGFFRPTKLWDVLVFHQGRLVVAVEFKSHVGPSFGKNFNNRSEEAIGTAHDLATAFQKEFLKDQPPPFTGWLILVEDCEKSNKTVREQSSHYPVRPEFKNTSCLARYEILCRKLIQERMYSQATVIVSPREARLTGDYRELSEMTGLRAFATRLAGHVAGWAQMFKPA